MRLDRFLCEKGQGSRTQAKALLRAGAVAVDGVTIKQPEYQVDETRAVVTVHGAPLLCGRFSYVMLHKPAGYLTARRDAHTPTVMELLRDTACRDLAPVGRLDKDTEGLLLLTNDGMLAHGLLHPRRAVDKRYYAVVRRISGEAPACGEAEIRAFAEGLRVNEAFQTLPARLELPDRADERLCRYRTETAAALLAEDATETLVTVQEGKFHQIKRMFLAVGCEVCYLKRLSIGSIWLDEGLRIGAWRYLTEQECDSLSASVRGE